MSELRLNLITREWVIIATDRARRPDEFAAQRRKQKPPDAAGCPFCPGGEELTPDEIMRIEGEEGWQLRVVPNKFATLSGDGSHEQYRDGRNHSMDGYGRHEVVIETPRHDCYIAHMQQDEVIRLLRAYKTRFDILYQDADIEHVIIFKNHGEAAGTSLQHPHSQIIALPMTPMQVCDRLDAYRRYADEHGECLMCATLADELAAACRIVLESEYFVTFIPYAALSPFHIWIFPRRHSVSFGDISGDELRDLARHMQHVLAKLYAGLDNPSFNYVIRSESPRASATEYFHWYISLVPRLSQPAGFELGSGMYINASIPEESAEFLRHVEV